MMIVLRLAGMVLLFTMLYATMYAALMTAFYHQGRILLERLP